jgi:tRNA 2-selenouridine synthase
MQHQGQAILNLEKLANHKGSAFGALGQQAQPSQEMFENKIATTLHISLAKHDQNGASSIWVEDESLRIGLLNIPKTIYENIRQSPVYFLEIPVEARLDYIVNDYSKFSQAQLIDCVERISKRLGGLETKNAINFLLEGNVKEAFCILLKYYDKWYSKGLQNRKTSVEYIEKIPCATIHNSNIEMLLQ